MTAFRAIRPLSLLLKKSAAAFNRRSQGVRCISSFSEKKTVFKPGKRKTLPVITQSEMGECGLACIAMISGYWQGGPGLEELRIRHAVSHKGTSLGTLIGVAREYGLVPRPLRVQLDHLRHLKLPCILHWNFNHFVVLREITKNHARIHDPAIGARKIALSELSNHFTGVALELTPDSANEKILPALPSLRLPNKHTTLRQFTHYKTVIPLLAWGAMYQATSLLIPYQIQVTLDTHAVSSQVQFLKQVAVGFFFIALLSFLLALLRSWKISASFAALNREWLTRMFEHLLTLPTTWFDKRTLGSISSHFSSAQHLQKGLSRIFVDYLIDGTLSVLLGLILMAYNPAFTVVCLCNLGLYLLARLFFQPKLKQAMSAQVMHTARQQSLFLESARGISAIKLHQRYQERLTRWLNALSCQQRADLELSSYASSLHALAMLLSNIDRIIIVWLGAVAVAQDSLTVGMLFAFIAYREQFASRAYSFIDKKFELHNLVVHDENISQIHSTPAENLTGNSANTTIPVSLDLELSDISFHYGNNEKNIISHLQLIIPQGQCVAITGVSGTGKSTLLKLLSGLLQPTSGSIKLGNTPITEMGLARYRSLLGVVFQDDHLFIGSIGDNISFLM
ncbi:peptidase domain-containing ABC transporter [Pseudomonas tolaasii]|uniref:peptidase domain-containing ABC transporter n=1 Tax=Pseudomonas tolaasii TaxID=29442 RepID=UPI0018E0F24D|nr:cysteine peptidase family C39 domain-containing protein [Pseudomonas tolaasii]